MLTQAIDQVSDSQASKLLINNWHLPSLVTEQRNTLCANLFPSNLVLQCQDKPNFPLGENSQLLQGQVVTAALRTLARALSLVGHIPYWWVLPWFLWLLFCSGKPHFATRTPQRAELALAYKDNLWNTLWFTFQMQSTRFWGWLQISNMTLFSQNRAQILLAQSLLPPLCHKEVPESDHCR